ncbi:MAG: Gfo/Idh/MocA family oxidoreductase [bacterium]|nr:Gfo/Idh/MocA family oxidoreductase [bacterium]
MKTIRVGLIGCGFMGKAHSNAYLNVSKFHSLKTKPVMSVICDKDRKTLKAFNDVWGWEKSMTDYKKMLKSGEVDLVDISTPNASHKEIALMAAEQGIHILCEKPLAMNSDEAREMVKAVKKAKVRNMVCFNYRRVPAIALAKQLIDEGKIGKVFHMRAVYLQDWIIDPKFPLVWRLKKETAGSGAHGDLSAHIIDLARYLVGDFSEVVGMDKTFIKKRPLAEVEGSLAASAGSKKKGDVTVDDAILFLAKFGNGAIGSFEATRFANGRRNGNRIEINGSKGSIAFNLERMNELEYFSGADPQHVQGFRTILATEPVHPYLKAYWPPGHIIGWEHTFLNVVFDFLEGISGKKSVAPDFTDGLKCQQVLDAVMKSAEEKCWINVDEM